MSPIDYSSPMRMLALREEEDMGVGIVSELVSWWIFIFYKFKGKSD